MSLQFPRPLRGAGALTGAALLAGALPLLAATPGHAVETGSSVVVFVRDGAVYRAAPDALGSPTLLVPASTGGAGQLASSADGSRFAYQVFEVNGSLSAMRTRVVVRDVSGRGVRTVDDRTLTFAASTVTGSLAGDPALSSNGSVAVWSVMSPTTASVLRVAEVAGGPAGNIAGSTDLQSPSFVDPSTLVAVDPTAGKLVTLPVAGASAPTLVTGTPTDVTWMGVSPDGGTLAYVVDPEYDDIGTLSTAPLTKQDDGSFTLGSATQLTDAYESFESPRFSHDGATVYWADDQTSGDTELYSAPTAGGAVANLTNTAGSVESHAVGAFVDSAAPLAAVAEPFTLAGSAATVRWELPPNGDVAGVLVSRPGKTVFVPVPATSYVDTGLAVGTTYPYTVTATDRSGNNASAAERSMTAAGAVATFSDPTSTGGTRAPFAVRFSPNVPASVTFDVAYRTNGSAGTRSWVEGLPGVVRTFGAAGGTFATASTPGSTYQFVVTAKDSFGNTSGPVASGRAVVPFDQTKATLSGGVNVARGDAWLGTLRTLNAAGQFARIGVTGDRFQVIGERCPTCGVVDIYDGSTRIASVDTRASARQARAVLYTKAWPTVGYHVLTLKPRGTAKRPNVVLDGFAVRR
jgi:hypothetical protein